VKCLPDEKEHLAMNVRKWVSREYNGFHFYIEGKALSHARMVGSMLVTEALVRGESARYVTSDDLVTAYFETIRSKDKAPFPYKMSPFEEINASRFVTLDLVGKDELEDWEKKCSQRMLTHRLNRGLSCAVIADRPLVALDGKGYDIANFLGASLQSSMYRTFVRCHLTAVEEVSC